MSRVIIEPVMPPKKRDTSKKRKASEDDTHDHFCAPSQVKWFFRKVGMQSDAVVNGHQAQLMFEDDVKGRFFVSMPTWADVYKTLVKKLTQPRYKHLNEIIPHGKPCKPYIDIDADELPQGISSVDQVIERTERLVRQIFAEDYKLGQDGVARRLPPEAFVWLHSGNQTKVSLHLILHSVEGPLLVFNSNHQADPQGAHPLARRLAELDPQGVGSMVDQVVYTKDRCIRMMSSSKASKPNSVLLPVRHPLDFATFKKSVISYLGNPEKQATQKIDVPKALPRLAKDLGKPVSSARVPSVKDICSSNGADPSSEDARITELVQEKIHPSARPVVPSCCVKAAESLVMNMISADHASNYNDWIITGYVLKRAKMPLKLWLRFSQRCPAKYSESSCVAHDIHIRRGCGVYRIHKLTTDLPQPRHKATRMVRRGIVLREIFDADIAKRMYRSDALDLLEKRELKKYIETGIKNARNGGAHANVTDDPTSASVEVVYKLHDKLKLGRYISAPVDRGCSMHYAQGAKRNVRSWLAFRFYHDIDIKNAHATIAVQLYERLQIECPCLKSYVNNRERILQKVQDACDVTRDAAKEAFIRMNYGGSLVAWCRDFGVDEDSVPSFLTKYQIETRENAKQLLAHPDFRVYVDAQKNKKPSAPNPASTQFAYVLQDLERQCLDVLIRAIVESGHTVGALLYDGALVMRKQTLPPFSASADHINLKNTPHISRADITKWENEIKRSTGLDIQLEEKIMELDNSYVTESETAPQFDCSDDASSISNVASLSMSTGTGRSERGPSDFEILRDRILLVAKRDMLFKRDRHVYRPLTPAAYEKAEGLDEFIKNVFLDDELFNRRPKNYDQLMHYFSESASTSDFPDLKIDRNIISFSDGVLVLNEMRFVRYPLNDDDDGKTALPLAPGSVARKHFNVECPVRSERPLTTRIEEEGTEHAKADILAGLAETPHWDRVIKYQVHDCEHQYRWLNTCLGRLFFPVGSMDNWQIMPFVNGDAGTGKSTVIDAVKAAFNPAACAVLTNNSETVFGLADKFDAEVLIAPDVPKETHKMLDQTLWQSMVTGESIQIPRKFTSSVTTDWRVPMIWAGNHVPNYKDNAGSVSRRMMVFGFRRHVPTEMVDTQISRKVVKDELPHIVCKWLTEYVITALTKGSETCWSFCPEAQKDEYDNVRRNTDMLYQFLTAAPEDNQSRTKRWYVKYEEGAITPLPRLKDAFRTYMKFKHPGLPSTWPEDESALKSLGYVVDKKHLCKSCEQRHIRGCCEHYSRANRVWRVVILGMRIVEEDVDPRT